MSQFVDHIQDNITRISNKTKAEYDLSPKDLYTLNILRGFRSDYDDIHDYYQMLQALDEVKAIVNKNIDQLKS